MEGRDRQTEDASVRGGERKEERAWCVLGGVAREAGGWEHCLIRPHVQSSIWLKAQQFTAPGYGWGTTRNNLEPRLGGSNPDALLTYSDREQMGSYLQGQKMPTPLPPDLRALTDHFIL